MSFVGGGGRVSSDVPPYMLAAGNDDPGIRNVNLVGMQRRGIPAATIAIIRQAHRLIYRQHKNLGRGAEIFTSKSANVCRSNWVRLLDFLER